MWNLIEYKTYPNGTYTTNVFIHPDGETGSQALLRQYSRPIESWQRLAEKVLSDAGESGELVWSNYAGCSFCPCTPGFVVSGSRQFSVGTDYYLVVTETADEPVEPLLWAGDYS